MFTAHHDEIDPIEDKFPEAIKKIRVKEELIPAALEFLDLSNITRYSVFPDLAGIAGFLKRTSGLSPGWERKIDSMALSYPPTA